MLTASSGSFLGGGTLTGNRSCRKIAAMVLDGIFQKTSLVVNQKPSNTNHSQPAHFPNHPLKHVKTIYNNQLLVNQRKSDVSQGVKVPTTTIQLLRRQGQVPKVPPWVPQRWVSRRKCPARCLQAGDQVLAKQLITVDDNAE